MSNWSQIDISITLKRGIEYKDLLEIIPHIELTNYGWSCQEPFISITNLFQGSEGGCKFQHNKDQIYIHGGIRDMPYFAEVQKDDPICDPFADLRKDFKTLIDLLDAKIGIKSASYQNENSYVGTHTIVIQNRKWFEQIIYPLKWMIGEDKETQ